MSYVYSKKVSVSLNNIRDHLAPLLYATGTVKDNEEVLSIELGKTEWDEGAEGWVVPITLEINKQMEVKTIKFDE